MHYENTTFAREGLASLVSRKNNTQVMGQRTGFSELDLKRINRLYSCGKVTHTFLLLYMLGRV